MHLYTVECSLIFQRDLACVPSVFQVFTQPVSSSAFNYVELFSLVFTFSFPIRILFNQVFNLNFSSTSSRLALYYFESKSASNVRFSVSLTFSTLSAGLIFELSRYSCLRMKIIPRLRVLWFSRIPTWRLFLSSLTVARLLSTHCRIISATGTSWISPKMAAQLVHPVQ